MIDRTARRTAVAAGATLGQLALVAWLLPLAQPVVESEPAASLDQLLVRACAGAALAAGTWLWLGTLLTVATGRGDGASARALPASVRRAVLAACGLALVGGLAVGPA